MQRLTCDVVNVPVQKRGWRLSLTATLRRALVVYWQSRERAATQRLLYSLSDRTLKDIGITRGEIHFLSCNPSGLRHPR